MKNAFIMINGYPGVGKLTVAKELRLVSFSSLSFLPLLLFLSTRHLSVLIGPRSTVLPHVKVFHNHLLIDAAAALYERGDPAYQPLRKALVGPFPIASLSRIRAHINYIRETPSSNHSAPLCPILSHSAVSSSSLNNSPAIRMAALS